MSSSDLVASMKALDLGPAPISEGSTASPKTRGKTQNKESCARNDRSKTSKYGSPRPDVLSKLPSTLPEGSTSQSSTQQDSSSQTSSKHKRRPRHRNKKAPQDRKPQGGNGTLPVSPEPKSSASQTKPAQASFAYVVKAANTFATAEKIIGVFTTLPKANAAALVYASKNGIPRNDIVDITSSINRPPARAVRRIWPDGASEILILNRSNVHTIKVLPKEVGDSEIEKVVYLALDSLFVIGVCGTKETAWEACRKYRGQLSYCSEIRDMGEWVDDWGLWHAKGVLDGKTHHWFVKQYDVDEMLQ